MLRHPRKKLKNDFDQAVAGDAYYSIFTIAPAADAPGKWDVKFCVSGSKDDPKALSPLDQKDVRRLLHLYYAFASDKPEYRAGDERNAHVARVDSKARAERLACELVYILQDAGLSPMKKDEGKYQPMAPQTSRPRFDRPSPPHIGF